MSLEIQLSLMLINLMNFGTTERVLVYLFCMMSMNKKKRNLIRIKDSSLSTMKSMLSEFPGSMLPKVLIGHSMPLLAA